MEFIYFIKDFFGAPAILIALFAFCGSLLQRKKFTDVMVSTLKAGGGYLILAGGIGILLTPLDLFTTAFKALTGGTNAVMGNSDAIAAAIMKNVPHVATLASLMMFIAIVLNIVLAKITRFKYIFLTGHHTLFMCVIFATICQFAGMNVDIMSGGKDSWYPIIVGSMFMALYMLLSPMFSKSAMEELTVGDKLYIGHANSMGLGIASGIGCLIGKATHKSKKIKSTEDIKFPKWLNVFSNTIVAVFVTMFFIFGITYCALWIKEGKAVFTSLPSGALTNTDSIIARIIIDALTFTAGVEVLIYGIKVMLDQLMPAIEGIGMRWIPKAKMGVDASVALAYRPNAVLIGFVTSFLGGIVGLLISIGLNAGAPKTFASIVVPGIIAHFICGGAAGTFANNKGGILGAVIAGFVNGLILTVIPLIFIAMQGVYSNYPWSNAEWGTDALQWAESDYLFFATIGWMLKVGWTKWILMTFVISLFTTLIVDGYFWNKNDRKNNLQFYVELKQSNLNYKQKILQAKKEKKQNKLNLKNKF